MSEETRSQELLLLGEIKGLVQGLKDGQDVQNQRLENVEGKLEMLDGRLRTVEQKAAVFGAVSGGAVSIGMALIIESLKGWLHKGP